MKVLDNIPDMLRYVNKAHSAGKKLALVPTMGYLHKGHLSLIRLAREKADLVVASIYVNPIQFGENEDVEKYPRDLDRDESLAENAGCDVIFYPSNEMMYPQNFQTSVRVNELTKGLCGLSRPIHFQGVTTVVAKLFNIIKPNIAVFGQKDAQQSIVISQMVRDLSFDIEIIIAPIIRHDDGLAMSSRNEYLSPQERIEATVLHKSLYLAKDKIEHGEKNAELLKSEMMALINCMESTRVDYIEIVDASTLVPVKEINGRVLIALAVFVGNTRLIDNLILTL
jgi:pantoate--beta-alanine ligase